MLDALDGDLRVSRLHTILKLQIVLQALQFGCLPEAPPTNTIVSYSCNHSCSAGEQQQLISQTRNFAGNCNSVDTQIARLNPQLHSQF